MAFLIFFMQANMSFPIGKSYEYLIATANGKQISFFFFVSCNFCPVFKIQQIKPEALECRLFPPYKKPCRVHCFLLVFSLYSLLHNYLATTNLVIARLKPFRFCFLRPYNNIIVKITSQ